MSVLQRPEAAAARAVAGFHRRFPRVVSRAARISPDAWAMLAILAAVILANLPYLLDFSDPNPLGPRSGLVSSVIAGPAGGAPTIDPNDGFISQAVSHRAVLDWAHLQLPWWNPYAGTGAPLAGEMQAAAFFPPTLLTALSNGQLYEHILLELIAGIATFLLLRRLGLNRVACAAAGIAFGLNGTFAWFGHAPVNPVPFLPLLLLGIEQAYAAAVAGRRGGWSLIAVAGALSVYGGFPEVAYINALLAVCWFGWRCGCAGRDRVKALLVKGAGGAFVGTLLSAPLLIAMADYFNHADLGPHATSTFGSGHIPAQGLTQLMLPYVFGPIFRFTDPKLTLGAIWDTVGGYLSTSLLLFAVIGFFSRRRRGLGLILLAWIILTVARMYGQPAVLGGILGWLPGMPQVAFFRYATSSLELAVIVLAAIGLDALSAQPQPRRRMLWVGGALLAVVAIAVIGVRPLTDRLGGAFNGRPFFALAIVWGCSVLIAGLAIATLRSRRTRLWLASILVAGDALVLFAAPELSAPRAVQTDLAPAGYLKRNLGDSRAFSLGPLQPNYGSYFGIGLLNVNDVPIPSALEHYIHARLDNVVEPTVFVGTLQGSRPIFAASPEQELLRNLAGYRAAAVKYVLTPPGQSLPQRPGEFRLVFQSPSTWIYQLAGSAPYFSVSNPQCHTLPAGREAVSLSCPSPTRLVRRETYMQGWSAVVDGHSVPVRRVDGLFQSVNVGAGSHRVTFSYAPPNIEWGFVAFVAGLALLLAEPVRRVIRRASAPVRASAG